MSYGPPTGYQTPPFPSLNVQTLRDKTEKRIYTLYHIGDVWRFTVIWTLAIYVAFHLGAIVIAATTHRRRPSSWKYLTGVTVIYLLVAGIEAILSASIVGVVVGAVYQTGYYEVNTWIPCVWAFINVLVLIISSFSIQGGL